MVPPPPINAFNALLFWLSFIGPLIVGLVCFIKYRTNKYGKFFTIFSFIFGLIIPMINLFISNLYSYYVNIDILILFIVIMMDFLFLPLFTFGSLKIISRRKENRSWKPLFQS